MKIEIICPVANFNTLHMNTNLCVERKLTILTGYTNVMKGYNYAITNSNSDVLVFIHHDVYLPAFFEEGLLSTIEELEQVDSNWGVLGCVGARNVDPFPKVVGWVRDRGFDRMSDLADHTPEVDTIDELLIVVKRDSGLTFDENIPSCHLYGADICLKSKELGKKCYVSRSLYCHHNSPRGYTLPAEFAHAYDYIKEKWKQYIPFRTTCAEFK